MKLGKFDRIYIFPFILELEFGSKLNRFINAEIFEKFDNNGIKTFSKPQ
jgi:hypothetical protein